MLLFTYEPMLIYLNAAIVKKKMFLKLFLTLYFMDYLG